MKGERLPANTSWRGIPAQSVSLDDYYEEAAQVIDSDSDSDMTTDDSTLPEMG